MISGEAHQNTDKAGAMVSVDYSVDNCAVHGHKKKLDQRVIYSFAVKLEASL